MITLRAMKNLSLSAFPQVRGLTVAAGSGGQGRGRTADLPLFRRQVRAGQAFRPPLGPLSLRNRWALLTGIAAGQGLL